MSQEEIHDLFAYDGVKIIQRTDMFRFSLDSLLLGDFVKINAKANRIIDFGTGLGPIPLFLSKKTNKPIIGIEIQDDAVELAKRSVSLNHLEDQITILKMDINEVGRYYKPSSFDIVIANPPFFKHHHDGFVNQLDSLSIARHEVLVDLEGIIKAARKILATGGALYLIHRAGRIEDLVQHLHNEKFAIKRMRFVYTKKEKEAMMVLIEARHNGSAGDTKVEPPLVIYDANNQYTPDVLKIFHLGDEQDETQSQLPK